MRQMRRREVLNAAIVAAGVGLAGCSSDDSGSDGGDDGDGSGSDTTTPAETTQAADDGATGSGDDSTPAESTPTESPPAESTPTEDPSKRQIPGEVSNDLTGLEVVDHEAAVGEDGFSGTVTVRNVGDETATLVDHAIEFKLYDADDSMLATVGSWGSENKEPAPDEESVMEFFDGPANDDVDFTLAESYLVELTCGTFETGVYCP